MFHKFYERKLLFSYLPLLTLILNPFFGRK
uniref:Ribosomal protein L36 n=1 Tax=Heteroplexis impressinervia TaxID=2789018 RepID=A0A8K1DZS2_9ASTR|nr:ribosomal protein L36 [Heteroplexis impressinervia]QPD06555.1 ribosomal protein L36 [Heteroplexis impressinervia]